MNVEIEDQLVLVRELLKNCSKQNKNFIKKFAETNGDQLYCSGVFDGYLCWPPTSAGAIATQNCPDFVSGFDKNRIAHKECNENGSWFVHPLSGRAWSNYTNCVDTKELEFHQLINSLYVGGYIVSLITLIISLCIFFSFRSLKCTRIRIHIQLFISLALSCIMWIFWYKFFIEVPNRFLEYENLCLAFHILLHYLMLTNYFWMFCEGLHLILVLVVVFVKDTIAMRWFLVIGWISPMVWLTIYGIVRGNSPDVEHCWTLESQTLWILIGPVLVSLIASTIFLAKVVRVLLTKLHPHSTQSAPLAIRKAARATLILVPLFGLQHFLLPFRPETGTTFDKIYQYLSAGIISLQGFCVSCLFCFANHDVIFVIRNVLHYHFPRLLSARTESINAPAATQSRDVNV